MSEAKKTPFYEKHLELGGKIVDYSGWLLPVQYPGGLVEEVNLTRRRAALFDVSHMGEISVEGEDAEAYLQRMVVNDLSRLGDNSVIYSPVCYPDGGVVDDILIYRLGPRSFFLVVNAANTEKDFTWFVENCAGKVAVENLSADYAQLALQGPKSEIILQQLTAEPLRDMGNYRFKPAVDVAGVMCIVSRTGYTGEDGFEIYCSPAGAAALWDAVWAAGQEHGLGPAGLGARDVLRLEASMPLYGHELGPDLTPLMAGLDRFVALSKEVNFNGKASLKKQKADGLPKKLYGLEMLERGVPRQGYPVTVGDREIGWVSSGSYSPTLNKFVAMAFLEPETVEKAEDIAIAIRSRTYGARKTEMPFYRRVR